jgi:3-isopropylmalate/(R)-2-methylmalate dehydratase large subunit
VRTIETLRKKHVAKRAAEVRLRGRILYLTEDPEIIRRQLAGDDLQWTPAIKLRDDISTDEITPASICFYFDETLGEFPYTGLKASGEFPIGRGDVKRGGFVASVAGKRRGKGSSREQSPYAEMAAGLRVVVAENLERIYKQNCQNLGLLTTTDFDLLSKISAGQPIALAAFYQGEDEITRQIIEYGGLFNFNLARLQGKARIPTIATAGRPMTLAEKILARHMVRDLAAGAVGVPAVKPGDAGFAACDIRFSHEYVTPMASIYFRELVGEGEKVNDPGSIYFFRDHLTFLDEVISPEKRAQGLLEVARQLERRQREFAEQQGIRLHGELTDRKGSEAICHSLVLQNYAQPGQVVVGSDSHTPHSGAIGCLAFGIGTTDIFNSWITRDVRVRVPESVKVVIRGRLSPAVTAKDLILEILRQDYVRSGGAIGKVIEYSGEAVSELDIDERATLTNMAAEIGGFTGIVAPDRKTVDYLVAWRGMSRSRAEQLCQGLASDGDAEYAQVLAIDAGALRPMVALPGDPGRGVFLDELPAPVKVDIAYGGSCTAGKPADMDMYARVLREALERGGAVHPGVKFFIQFGSQETREYCAGKGYLDIFERAGAIVIEPSCGACINAGPGASAREDQVTVSAQNRNFPGRSGPGQVYLASPLTVAASAVAGRLSAFQPRESSG